MNIYRKILLVILAVISLPLHAVTYTKQDSTKVVSLLQKGSKQTSPTTPLTLFYANQLLGLPYVASTLEVNDAEQLVVNLREMDCTTLIDNVMALTLTTQQGSTRFEDFCYWLQRIRYRDGKMTDYTSRNHYYSQNILSNERLGIVQEIHGSQNNNYAPFVAQQTIDLHYMSQHPDQYRMLKNAPQSYKDRIRQYEKEVNGKVVRYIPTSQLNKSRKELACIQDGDILALVTSKDGLDVSHLGLAVWGQDGKLHLLNASSISKKVILDPQTLYQYMTKQKHRLGIRVIRLKDQNK